MARRGGGRPVTQREEAQPGASRKPKPAHVAASVRIVDPLQLWLIEERVRLRIDGTHQGGCCGASSADSREAKEKSEERRVSLPGAIA